MNPVWQRAKCQLHIKTCPGLSYPPLKLTLAKLALVIRLEV